MSEDLHGIALRLNVLLGEAEMEPLEAGLDEQFARYCRLLMRWNARFNLTALRDEESILSRHFVESIACARALPTGIATVLDFGSGAGFPGVPIALCRQEIAVTLAESQGKKVAFLREAIRVLGISTAVYGGRAEELKESFDCVTLRAVDRMAQAVEAAARLVRNGGWLAPLTTDGEVEKLKASAGTGFSWGDSMGLPGGGDRVLAFAQRDLNLPA